MTNTFKGAYRVGDSITGIGEGYEDYVHSVGVKEMPAEERPREKMIQYGAEYLTDAELMAILLRTGSSQKSVLTLGRELTADGGLYKHLAGVKRISELLHIKGLGKAKATTILAAIEIGRRLATARPLDKVVFEGPYAGAMFLMPRMRYLVKEQFVVIFLNGKNRIVGSEVVSEGTLTESPVHPREVFETAILHHAASIVVAHNHPSGDPLPSENDRETTKLLVQAGETLGIPVLDHLIIGDGKYYSFEEAGAIERNNEHSCEQR